MNRELVDQVHHGDCVDLLAALPDGSAQLIIADPPYNLGPAFGNSHEWRHDSDWAAWCRTWLEECHRVLRPDGNLFVYGIHHYLCYLQVALYEMGLVYRRQIIWHYENGFSRTTTTLANHYEPLLWFAEDAKSYYRTIREPYKSTERLKHPITKGGRVWTPHPDGRLAGDVWKFPTLAGRRFRDEKVNHPTQKPLALTDRIVQHFSEEGALVVVPFAGSGTECVSAATNGRHYWGAEVNAAYAELARQRVSEAVAVVTSPSRPAC